MAGHSQFKNIMYRKGAQDAKKAKVFTKLAKEITVAAKSNLDPASNPRLRLAIQAARKINMPNENIKRALAKADTSSNESNYEAIRYEGYAPGQIAVIVETLTDNRNRTASEIRSLFNKNGGVMGEVNSVSFNFQRVGVIHYRKEIATGEVMFEAALNVGAEDVQSSENGHEITCAPDDLHQVVGALEKQFGEPEEAKLSWKPQNLISLDRERAEQFIKFMDAIEDNDDVQHVSSNADIPDAILKELGDG